jgi:uncharacterized protein (DUF362 family)
MPKAVKLKKALVHKEILDNDVFINVPVLKHHGGAKLTICMKNLMGTVWDRRFFHDNGLDQCIADIAFAGRRPDLNIIDAYRILRRNGPQGRALEDGEVAKYLMMGKDMVALDAAAAKLFDAKADPLKYVRLAGEAGLGNADLSTVKIKRITLS